MTARRKYDFHDPPSTGRGLVVVERDPLGRDTEIAYDDFGLMPVEVTDPAGLVTEASYDYRLFQPLEVTDPNGNRTAFAYTPAGLVAATAVMGKTSESVGDTLEDPGVTFTYDLFAFVDRAEPVSVRTTRRIHHVHDTDVAEPERHETIETVEYSDGFGRLLQTRTQAEDVVFGSDAFGDAGLPAAQGSNGDAVGQELPRSRRRASW